MCYTILWHEYFLRKQNEVCVGQWIYILHCLEVMALSIVTLIAYDYPLPKTEFHSGFSILGNYYASCYEVSDFATKKFKYDISLEINNQCIEDLRNYLAKSMVTDTEVELWRIWLGGDYTKPYKEKVPVKHIRSCELDDVYDGIDLYTENSFVPQRKETSIMTLAEDDISFVLDNWCVCLAIKKESVGV